jgi:NAD+ kinase
MNNLKICLIADNTTKALLAKKQILKLYRNYPVSKCSFIVIIGGDGFMLHSLKKYYKYNKPFYGMNKGNHGFLLNPFSVNNLVKNIQKSNKITLHPLEMTVQVKGRILKKKIAINEISIFRQSKQASKLEIKVDNKTRIKELTGDGALVATPAGSTAYNLSVRGPILNLDSHHLAITPISPFRPRGWRGAIVSNKSKIVIRNLDPKKRPVSAVADNTEIRNAILIKISVNQEIGFKLLYNKKFGLQERNLAEQFKF